MNYFFLPEKYVQNVIPTLMENISLSVMEKYLYNQLPINVGNRMSAVSCEMNRIFDKPRNFDSHIPFLSKTPKQLNQSILHFQSFTFPESHAVFQVQF